MDEAQHNQAGIITDILDKGATIILNPNHNEPRKKIYEFKIFIIT